MRKVVALTSILITFLLGSSARADIASVFGGAVSCTVQGNGVRFCGATDSSVPTWDGTTPIDVNVAFPPVPASGPDGNYPLIGIYHGWGGSKIALGTLQAYALRGYAAFSMSDRGWGNSCGATDSKRPTPACAAGYNHLLDTRYEVRDAQYLIGQLVDQGVVDPQRIGATGGSYGGGMSMALAALENRVMMPDGTLVPWTSPAHGAPMRIAAAAPEIPWTDLANSLLPNGHTLDYVTDAPYMKRGRIGVMKQSFVAGLYALGKASSNYAAPGTDPDADLDSWYALINAGEPYDQNPQATDIVDEVTTHHSSYYIDHSIAPAPLLISNGGTDDLFPVDEAVRFYNRTRSEYPGADIALFFLDYGHQRGENKSADVALLHQQQDAWFDYYLKGVGPTPFHGVTALTQNCGGASEGPYSAPSWADLAPGEIRLSSAAAQTIVPGSGDSSRGRTYDPISGGGACATADGSDQTGVASYRLDPAPAGGFTLAGATTIVADINSAGPTSQIAARLLDVASDGSATLVARGLYRPEINSGTDPTHQVFQLHPNAYHFAEGHVAKLELLPADAPYGRVSNGQATVTVSNLELRLPVLEQPNGTLVQPPAPKVVPPGYQLAFCSSDGDCDDANVCNGAETCVDHACVAGTQLDCDDHDPCTTDTCDASGGCAHAPSCAPLAITRAMIRTGVGRGFITVKGTLTTPPALSGNPPVGVEVQDSSGHDQARTFTSCTVRGTRVRCSDTVSLVILKGVGAGPGTVKLGVKLRQLTLAPPLAGPVTVRLTHDGVGHRGSISTCGVVGSSLRCSSR